VGQLKPPELTQVKQGVALKRLAATLQAGKLSGE
jgi:hypothetical protein